ncbi:MAG TPA: hypothetical protein VGN21_02020 [Stellaceae bacterium]
MPTARHDPPRPLTQLPVLLCVCAALVGLAGCLSQRPFLQSGDVTSAEVVYSGDVANAVPVARQHCVSHARVPRLVDTTPGIAYFACDPP